MSSASRPGARAMARPSARWSMAARRACRCRRRRSSPGSTGAVPARRAMSPSGGRRTRWKSSPGSRIRRRHHRHAHRAGDPQHRPALEGLRRHRGQVPPRPCRLRLSRQIWRAGLSRRRPLLGARDCCAGRCRGRGARRRCTGRRHRDPRRCRADRRRMRIDRENWDWADIVERQSRSGAPTPAWCPNGKTILDGTRKAGSSVGAIVEVQASGAPAGLGRAHLRQAGSANSPAR
jgi:hypothetical protein